MDFTFIKKKSGVWGILFGPNDILGKGEGVLVGLDHVDPTLKAAVINQLTYQASIIPHSHTWLLPVYFVVSLGCYGLVMVGIGLVEFPTCLQEAVLLQQDVAEAKKFLKQRGVDVGGFD